MKKIEVLATLGPSSLNEDTIKQLSDKGVTLFRINLSHTTVDKVAPTIDTIRKYSDIPISLDSEGAQIRNKAMINGSVVLKKGEQIQISSSTEPGDERNISFTPSEIEKSFKIGDKIKIDFQSTEIRIIEKSADTCIAEVEIGGKIGSNKAANLDRDIILDPITPKDYEAIKIGKSKGISNYALSFANRGEDVDLMRELIGDDARLISKIESKSALRNLKDICERSDAILIDRGDLSRQVPIEKIPFLQRKIIAAGNYSNVPVFVATNLLESMIEQNTPTRAEVNDVVSTLLMGADGLVLAAETAIGKYPCDAVTMIQKLIQQYQRWTPFTDINQLVE